MNSSSGSSSSCSIVADYLGWKPADGVMGREFVDPIVRHLTSKRTAVAAAAAKRGLAAARLKRHRIEFVRRKLRISELPPAAAAAGKPRRYPSIPINDVAGLYLYESADHTDPRVFALVLLGYNEDSNRSVHVHAWRGAAVDEVFEFAGKLNRSLTTREHLQLIHRKEQQLVAQNEVQESGFFRFMQQQQQQQEQEQQHEQQRHKATPAASMAKQSPAATSLGAVAVELRQRLNNTSGAPLLHPPRDYDTLHRSHGNAMLRSTERPLCSDSQAPGGAYIRRSTVVTGDNNNVNQVPNANPAELDDDEDDYDSEYDNDDEDLGGTSSSAGDSSLSSSRGLNASGGSGDFGDISVDARRGFSTWKRRHLQQQLFLLQQQEQLQQQQQQNQQQQQQRQQHGRHSRLSKIG